MVVINDTAGVKALEELLTAKQYTDKKVVHWWKTSAKDFADGKLVMMINFSNYASEILGAGSKVVGNIGVAMVPGKIRFMEEEQLEFPKQPQKRRCICIYQMDHNRAGGVWHGSTWERFSMCENI